MGKAEAGTWRGTNNLNFSRLSRAVAGKVRPKGADSVGRKEKMTAKVESAERQRGLVLRGLITVLTQRFPGR